MRPYDYWEYFFIFEHTLETLGTLLQFHTRMLPTNS